MPVGVHFYVCVSMTGPVYVRVQVVAMGAAIQGGVLRGDVKVRPCDSSFHSLIYKFTQFALCVGKGRHQHWFVSQGPVSACAVERLCC
jgi:hypothetical protein